MKQLIFILILLLSGCATASLAEKKREDIIKCVKELKQNDSETLDSFEVCRQIYGLKKQK